MNDKLQSIFVNFIEVLAVKETPIDYQKINGAGCLSIFFGLFQHHKEMQIVRFFDPYRSGTDK